LKVETKRHEFDFENLSVYQKGLKFVNAIFSLSDGLPPKVQYSLGNQLRRAALSVVNNIAEGSNKRTAKEKTQFYRFALDSARECVPMLTLCRDQEFLTQQLHESLRVQCLELCRMLNGLVNAVGR
jgi:four helix bundle protein